MKKQASGIKYWSFLILMLLGLWMILRNSGSSSGSGGTEADIMPWSPDSTLTPEDFHYKGFKWNVLKYDAGVASTVLLKQGEDSLYRGEAVVLKDKSWYRVKYPSEPLLRHEMYHANITAVVAREFNDVLKEVPMKRRDYAMDLLRRYKMRLDTLNARYDAVTGHGTRIPMQSYWEYKIDSLYYRFDQSYYTDHFSGLGFYFPVPLQSSFQKDSFSLRRVFSVSRYNMKYHLVSYLDMPYFERSQLKKGILYNLRSIGITRIDTSRTDPLKDELIRFQGYDSTSRSYLYGKVLMQEPYIHLIVVYIPEDQVGSRPYQILKDRFFNSVTLTSQEEYWMEAARSHPHPARVVLDEPHKGHKGEKRQNRETYSLHLPGTSTFSVYYHVPFIRDDTLVVPFLVAGGDVRDIQDYVLVINRRTLIFQSPDSDTSLFVIPLAQIGCRRVDVLDFGYTLKQDSAATCYELKGISWDFNEYNSRNAQ